MAAKRMIATDIVAIIIGGVVGTVANSLAVSLFTDASFQNIVLAYGRYIVAIAVTALFAICYRTFPTSIAAILSLLIGILVPSILAKAFFGAGMASWTVLFAFNAIFAVVALMVYRAIHNWAKSALFRAEGFRA